MYEPNVHKYFLECMNALHLEFEERPHGPLNTICYLYIKMCYTLAVQITQC